MSLLRSGNEQCFIVSPLDGKVLIGQDGFCVTIPGHNKVGGTLDGTGQDDRAADPRLQVFGRQGDPQRLWRCKKGPGRDELKKKEKKKQILFEMSVSQKRLPKY